MLCSVVLYFYFVVLCAVLYAVCAVRCALCACVLCAVCAVCWCVLCAVWACCPVCCVHRVPCAVPWLCHVPCILYLYIYRVGDASPPMYAIATVLCSVVL